MTVALACQDHLNKLTRLIEAHHDGRPPAPPLPSPEDVILPNTTDPPVGALLSSNTNHPHVPARKTSGPRTPVLHPARTLNAQRTSTTGRVSAFQVSPPHHTTNHSRRSPASSHPPLAPPDLPSSQGETCTSKWSPALSSAHDSSLQDIFPALYAGVYEPGSERGSWKTQPIYLPCSLLSFPLPLMCCPGAAGVESPVGLGEFLK